MKFPFETRAHHRRGASSLKGIPPAIEQKEIDDERVKRRKSRSRACGKWAEEEESAGVPSGGGPAYQPRRGAKAESNAVVIA
jgi:hypothetical protein